MKFRRRINAFILMIVFSLHFKLLLFLCVQFSKLLTFQYVMPFVLNIFMDWTQIKNDDFYMRILTFLQFVYRDTKNIQLNK